MKKILFVLSLLTVVYSCQKEIDVDLNEANPVVIIESNYTAEDSTVRVSITLTSNYFSADAQPTIDAATVTITDASGTSNNIPNIGNGMFELSNYIPQFNTTYTLNVVYDGTSYTALSDMPEVVQLEDITFEYFPSFFGLDPGYISYLNVNDPAGVVNNYIVVLTRNGNELSKLTELFLQDDKLTDGNLIERPLFNSDFFQIGDTIGMELRSVDQEVYDYYGEIKSIANGGGNSAAPANPTSNWNNGALGYFSAYSNSRKEGIIQ